MAARPLGWRSTCQIPCFGWSLPFFRCSSRGSINSEKYLRTPPDGSPASRFIPCDRKRYRLLHALRPERALTIDRYPVGTLFHGLDAEIAVERADIMLGRFVQRFR